LFGIGEIHSGVKDRVRECLLPFSSPSVIFLLAFKNIKIKIHKTVMLHVFIRSVALILREKHGMCLENRMLRMFANKREKVTRGWRELLNEEIHNLYPSLNIISVINKRPHTCSMHEREEKYTKFGQKILGGHPILILGISTSPVKRIWWLCRLTVRKSIPYSTVSGYFIKPLIFH